MSRGSFHAMVSRGACLQTFALVLKVTSNPPLECKFSGYI